MMLSKSRKVEKPDMPLPGGPANKFGTRYELLWTVICMVDVMTEKADSIRLEPPGIEGEGFEFRLSKGAGREYHQVKRQHSGQGRWSISTLIRERILSYFGDKLRDPDANCVFVSTQAADEISELSDRAVRAQSWEEFQNIFLGSAQYATHFSKLKACWRDYHPHEIFELLKRIKINTIDEGMLRGLATSRIEPLVEGDPKNVIDILQQLALEKIHHELGAMDLWKHLDARGHHRRKWSGDPSVSQAVIEQTKRYLSSLEWQAIGGQLAHRDEVQNIVQKLTSVNDKRGVMVVGRAGMGKSFVVLQVTRELMKRGWPVLAFRADRLDPTSLPRLIGKQLDLPGSPTSVLSEISSDRDCLLVIDQLDAVSVITGRSPQLLECLAEVINQSEFFPKMKLLLSCRKFDLDNDPALRRFSDRDGVAQQVDIGPFSHDRVREIVSQLGLDSERLNHKQLELLATPFHLSLLAQIAGTMPEDSLNFRTTNELFNMFWEVKGGAVISRVGSDANFVEVIDILTGYMSNRQTLIAPTFLVDKCQSDANAMVSENILIRDGERLAFFHQSFFDYAFARRFAAKGGQLISLLGEGEQHLFRRSQVRQILLYERDTEFQFYLSDIRKMLRDESIRFHIKKTVLTLLAELDNPTEKEWTILSEIVESNHANPLADHVWQTIYGSIAWFNLLDSLGLIAKWLASRSQRTTDRTVWLLGGIQRQEANRVAELLEPYSQGLGKWRERLVSLFQWGELNSGRKYFDLALKLIDNGVFDQARGPIAVNSDFWSLVYSLSTQESAWSCEIIGHYLKRRFTLSVDSGQPNPFDAGPDKVDDSGTDEHVIQFSAKGAPYAFVEHILPFMQSIIEATADKNTNPPWRDSIWGSRFYGTVYSVKDALIAGMEASLSTLAKENPSTFSKTSKQLRESNFETIQYLLVRAYASNGKRFADEAAEYLLAKTTRLITGDMSYPCWASRQLLEAITPHCSVGMLQRLQKTILDFYPNFERKVEGRKFRGHSQWVLLDGIAESRRSLEAIRRLQELKRKFGPTSPVKPRPIEVMSVLSPIPDSAANKMTDDQWLKAIHKYRADSLNSDADGRMTGGVHQLANVLEARATSDLSRFASLALRFPDDTNPAYFDAVLRVIARSELDSSLVLKVCQRCHRIPGRPCGQWICQPIGKLSESSLPNEALDLVAWYGTRDPDPAHEQWQINANEDSRFYGGDPLTNGINTARGTAAGVIAQLLFHDGNRISYFSETLRQMVRDPSIAVRSCVAQTLLGVLRHDRDLAVNLFLELCDANDVLLGTPHVEMFLRYGVQTHRKLLLPIIERMLNSSLPDVAKAGSREACMAALTLEDVQSLARSCLYGSDSLRLGAAEVFAANLNTAPYRAFCEESLFVLFQDANTEVQEKSARCFYSIGHASLGEFTELVRRFIESPAFVSNHGNLIRVLDKTATELPEITLRACQRFLEVVGSSAADIRTASAADAEVISRLVVRLYSQSLDETLRTKCLDLLDSMIVTGVYGLEKAIELFER